MIAPIRSAPRRRRGTRPTTDRPGTVASNPACWNRPDGDAALGLDRGAEREERPLGVIPRRRRLEHRRRPARGEPGEQDALFTCALGAGTRTRCLAAPADDRDRRVPVVRLTRPPHRPQGAGHALHRAAGEALVAGEHRAGTARRGDTRPSATASSSRSSAVEVAVGLDERRPDPHPRPQVAGSTLTLDPRVPRGTLTLGGARIVGSPPSSEGRALLESCARHAAVERTSREVGSLKQTARPGGRRGQDQPAVRDRLVARHRWSPRSAARLDHDPHRSLASGSLVGSRPPSPSTAAAGRPPRRPP